MSQFFIGRALELARLHDISKLAKPSMVVITGRRRIGKSRLVHEFARSQAFLSFSGIAPASSSTAQDQRDAFARSLFNQLKIPPFTFEDWSEGFDHLAAHLSEMPTIVLFDEISWMGDKDPLFIAKLKNWWDLKLQNFPWLTVVLCGSVSTWIEKNIIKSTALFGRISLKIHLEELSLPESYEFLRKKGFQGSDYEVLKILAVMGGVPWYLEQIDPHYNADHNIQRLLLSPNGPLYDEYSHIFHDLFSAKGTIYQSITESLATGMKTLKQLREETHYSNSGVFGDYLQNLVISGFVDEHPQWSLKSESPAKNSLFRLKDNYLRFYLRYLAKKRRLSGSVQAASLESLPGWDSIMGLQVEALLLNNRKFIHEKLGLSSIVASGPYQQQKTKARHGCQIDYLIQTDTKTLYLCEFKFSRKAIGVEVLESMQSKVKALEIPRGVGVCLVLIHCSHITKNLDLSDALYRVIGIEDLL